MLKTCPFQLENAAPRILWEITSKCNLKCAHCLYYSNSHQPSCDLSLQQICEIIDQIAEDGRIREIWLSGGEPMLRKDIMEIISYISQKGLIPSLSSNGTRIDESNASELYRCGIRYVHVSIDGINAQTHDTLRGVSGAFEKTIHAVKAMRKTGIVVGASFMVTDRSINQVEAMADFAHELEISTLSFYQVEPLGRAISKDFGQCLNEQLNQVMQRMKAKYQNVQWRLEFPRLFAGEEDILDVCHAEKFLTITSDGELGVCPWMMKSEGRFSGGNLLKTHLNEIWARNYEYIVQLKRKRREGTVCKTCPDSTFCNQGCPAVSRYSSDFPYGFDPACKRGNL